jgi:hypothetical protein
MKPKTRGCKELLKLLGGDVNDPVPTTLEEASMIHEEQKEQSYVNCHTVIRKDDSYMKVCYGSPGRPIPQPSTTSTRAVTLHDSARISATNARRGTCRAASIDRLRWG